MRTTLISVGLVLTFVLVAECQDDSAPNGPSRTALFESEALNELGEQAEYLVARTLHELTRMFKDMDQDEMRGNVELLVEKAKKVLDQGMEITKGMDFQNVDSFVEFVKTTLDKKLAEMNTMSAEDMEQEIQSSVEYFLNIFRDFMQSTLDADDLFDVLA